MNQQQQMLAALSGDGTHSFTQPPPLLGGGVAPGSPDYANPRSPTSPISPTLSPTVVSPTHHTVARSARANPYQLEQKLRLAEQEEREYFELSARRTIGLEDAEEERFAMLELKREEQAALQASVPRQVFLAGRVGRGAFMNGVYDLLRVINGQPLYQSRGAVPPDWGRAQGDRLVIYNDTRQRTWALTARGDLGTTLAIATCHDPGLPLHANDRMWAFAEIGGLQIDARIRVGAVAPRKHAPPAAAPTQPEPEPEPESEEEEEEEVVAEPQPDWEPEPVLEPVPYEEEVIRDRATGRVIGKKRRELAPKDLPVADVDFQKALKKRENLHRVLGDRRQKLRSHMGRISVRKGKVGWTEKEINSIMGDGLGDQTFTVDELTTALRETGSHKSFRGAKSERIAAKLGAKPDHLVTTMEFCKAIQDMDWYVGAEMSIEEKKRHLTELFQNADVSGPEGQSDGLLDRSELMFWFNLREFRSVVGDVSIFDQDGDAKVDIDEIIKAIDQNGDGKISLDELLDFFDSQMDRASGGVVGKTPREAAPANTRDNVIGIKASGPLKWTPEEMELFRRDDPIGKSFTVDELTTRLRDAKMRVSYRFADSKRIAESEFLKKKTDDLVTIGEFSRAVEHMEWYIGDKMTISEKKEYLTRLFKSADGKAGADADGLLESKELHYWFNIGEFRSLVGDFSSFDQDEDGKVNVDEIIEKLDSSKDGKISLDELFAFFDPK